MKAPRAALVLALIIALLPDARAQGHTEAAEESIEGSADTPQGVTPTEENPAIISTIAATTPETVTVNTTSIIIEEEDTQLEFILMVLIPLIFLALLLLSVVLIVIKYKRKKNKQEPSSLGSQSALQTYELGSDNLKLPIFEEDTPSVMEIEMEELDKWMNSMNRNADSECLPTLKEEKESNHNPSDNES
ncbi:transmembrane protein 154 isoform 1-T1 [Rhynchonycteris naso]